MSLKAKVRNVASKNNASPQATLAMYMFERILMRIEKSKYQDNIILKGGLFLSSLIGIDMRTTKDMDANIKGLPITKTKMIEVFTDILEINLNDNIEFNILGISDIRKENKYDSFEMMIEATYEEMIVPLSIDISVGDIITPREMKYKYKKIFDDGYINILTYTVETVIAEKFETIISRGINNTRAKDFYDLYMLLTSKRDLIDNQILIKAINNTFSYRNTKSYLSIIYEIYGELKTSQNLIRIWNVYSNTNKFANDISFDSVMQAIEIIIEIISKEVVTA
jgi:predicted nucleotidyltransferase component of viral defense system